MFNVLHSILKFSSTSHSLIQFLKSLCIVMIGKCTNITKNINTSPQVVYYAIYQVNFGSMKPGNRFVTHQILYQTLTYCQYHASLEGFTSSATNSLVDGKAASDFRLKNRYLETLSISWHPFKHSINVTWIKFTRDRFKNVYLRRPVF